MSKKLKLIIKEKQKQNYNKNIHTKQFVKQTTHTHTEILAFVNR